MATRKSLRCRKPVFRGESVATAGPSRSTTASVKATASKDESESEMDDLPQIPIFGLSELAFSGPSDAQSYSEDDSISANDSSVTTGAVKKKRIRNPPKEPVICPVCGKNFTRKAHLVRHMYLHTGEKPFECSLCDQSFNRKDHLRSHLKGHSDLKEFPCNHCHCSFRRMDLLRVHVLKNHGKYQKTFKPSTNSTALKVNGTGAQSTTTQSGLPALGFKIHNGHLVTREQSSGDLADADGDVTEDVDPDNENEEEEEVEQQSAGNMEDEDEELEDEDDLGDAPTQESIIKQMLENQEIEKKFECVVCAKIFKEQRSLRRHYKLHKRNFICRFCGIKMSSAGSLMRHNLLHTGEKPFTCELCNRKFSRKDALKAHILAHQKESSKVSLPRPFRCRLCPASYTMRYNLIRHLRQSHHSQMNQSRPAPAPPQKITEPAKVESEPDKEQLGEDDNPLKCKHCGKIFANMKSLSTHYWYHNQEKRFVCKICNHGFKYATDLNRHYMTHKGKRTTSLTQQIAQNRLAQARQYQQNSGQCQTASGGAHRAAPTHNSVIINGHRVYPCQVCGQVFNHRSNRSRHMRMFHKTTQQALMAGAIRPPQLQSQSQASSKPTLRPAVKSEALQLQQSPTRTKDDIMSQAALILAQRQQQPRKLSTDSMEDEPPNYNGMWKCMHCGKIFDKRYNYKLHMRTHNKQFACLVCGLRTASQGDLTMHVRTHTGEKPFKCSKCDWRFARRSALTVHYRRHHGPQAKVRRHYNPQRITPNLSMGLSVAAQLRENEDLDEDQGQDSSILKNMLEGYPSKAEPAEVNDDEVDEEMEEQRPVQTEARLPKKNLPPPPPLIRYPLPSGGILPKKQEDDAKQSPSHQSEDLAPEMVFLCRPCGTLITGKDEYVNHMVATHDTEVTIASSSKQAQSHSRPGLPKLQQRPPGTQQLKAPVACQQCGEEFPSRYEMTVHTLATHSTPNDSVACGICRKLCTTLGFLSRHYIYAHPNAKNAAEEARMQMMESSHLDLDSSEQYQNQDEGEEYYDNGEGADASAEQLLVPEVVIKEENDEEVYETGAEELVQTEFLEMETEVQDDLPEISSHISVTRITPKTNQLANLPLKIDPNLPFPCPLCNKCFKDKKALADHRWYHGRQAIHPCTVCGKRFKLKNDLIRHLRRHLQERPHPCPEEGCESRFYQKVDLDRHLAKVHNQLDSMPYPCQHCNSRFAQAATLIRHLRSTHPGKDISNALLLQMHEQKKKNEEKQMYEYLKNLAPEEEEENVTVDLDTENPQQQEKDEEEEEPDYSFELQQLEIDTTNEEEQGDVGDEEEPDPQQMATQVGMAGSSVDSGPPYNCETCGKVYDDRQKFIYHRYYHLRDYRYSCPHCDEKFKIKGHVDRHVRTYHNSDRPVRQILHCPETGCARKFTRDYDLTNHIANFHNKEMYSQHLGESEEIAGGEGEDGYGAFSVEVDIQEVDETSSHTKAEGGYEFWDEGENDVDEDIHVETDASTSILQPCMNKLQDYTNAKGELYCKPCNKRFNDLKTLQNHIYYHSREPKHPCDSCGAKFKQKSDLRRHISIHHDPNKKRVCIPCPQCNRSFTDERYLRIHLNKNCEGRQGHDGNEGEAHDQEETNEDYEMPEEVEDSHNLLFSPQVEMEEVDQDQEEYAQEGWEETPDVNPLMFVSSDMNMGEEDAGGDYVDEEYNTEPVAPRTFDCDICGAYFSRSNELLLHKRSHANTTKPSQSGGSTTHSKKLKTFTCDKCGMSFLQKGELTQHLQQYHIEELQVYQCTYCPKFFYVKKSLDTHRRRHHSHQMNLQPCKICGAKFSKPEYLATHMKSHHTN